MHENIIIPPVMNKNLRPNRSTTLAEIRTDAKLTTPSMIEESKAPSCPKPKDLKRFGE
jgi:hypothetical protein